MGRVDGQLDLAGRAVLEIRVCVRVAAGRYLFVCVWCDDTSCDDRALAWLAGGGMRRACGETPTVW